MRIDSPSYRKAFELYLRRGVPMHRSLKAEARTGQYVWRTQEDGIYRNIQTPEIKTTFLNPQTESLCLISA
ncbi:MAG: hypothetical protein K0R63_950 [Rickettsiales bacterium]|jgi:hypothetical protein|nr:hypothetical protein [Rickettsiales bacterium]